MSVPRITTADGIITDEVALFCGERRAVTRDPELGGYAICVRAHEDAPWLWLERAETLEAATCP